MMNLNEQMLCTHNNEKYKRDANLWIVVHDPISVFSRSYVMEVHISGYKPI